ncbi:AAA family ATPase [Prosthecobacter fluviatilis]|uniref:AAA family ATPase n=1 Tax=Prosthecobacter fluviatilis TaxID=445931 RepID=A0ABW0KTN5_9BACT
MRLLAVRLQNLNSLSGMHEVRFDAVPLSTAGVFLITGPTGAGKSTLLDAMTLALYGRAARYGNDKADEMMSRHTMECFAEVDFETGGRKLRATWRLGKTKGGNLRPVQRTLADASTLEILADKGREMDPMIESLTGLDAQRFLRSVLLAQGQFAAFLKAKPNERAELLEKITGTEIYSDLSVLAYETHKAKDEAARLLKERLGAVQVLDEEKRTQLETDLTAARTSAESLRMDSDAASRQLHAQREHGSIAREITKLIVTSRSQQEAVTAASHEASHAKAGAEAAKQERARREPVWEQAAGMAAQSEQFEKQLGESRTMYQTWAKDQKEASARRATAEKALATHLEATEALEEWLRQNAGDAQLGEALPKLRTSLRAWRSAYEKLAEHRKCHAEAAALKQKLAEVEAHANELAKQRDEKNAKLKRDRAESERLGKMLEGQREVVRRAELVAGFDEHRHDLKTGEPCPLCGALEHPYAHTTTDFESQLQGARKLLGTLEKQWEKAGRDLGTLERELAKNEAEVAAEKKRAAEMKKRVMELEAPTDEELRQWEAEEKEKRMALAGLPHSGEPGYGPDAAERELGALEQRVTVFAKRRDEAAQKRGERQRLESDIQLATQEDAAKSKRLEELKNEGVTLRAKADALKSQLNELLGGRTLAQDREQHENRVATAEKIWREAEAKLNALQTQMAATLAKLEQLEVRRKPFEGQAVPDEEGLRHLEMAAKRLDDEFAARRTELGSLQQQVINDDAARKRRETGGAELQAAEAEALRWGRLRELIGSADGAKFSKFAQSLTLRQLIGLANEHLKVLAERYRLMAAEGDELDLRIVDLYQANVDRPMESLSGGESFLASLALALGLSELASRHHPIDSLFIDEGFGTLDTGTLEVALSALENLRSRGKTIGLISHVELLKERLTTQVRVVRGAGGTSRIEVVA